jgi:hypothetical protein
MFSLEAVPHEPGVDMGPGVAGLGVAIFVRVELLRDCGLACVEQRGRREPGVHDATYIAARTATSLSRTTAGPRLSDVDAPSAKDVGCVFGGFPG